MSKASDYAKAVKTVKDGELKCMPPRPGSRGGTVLAEIIADGRLKLDHSTPLDRGDALFLAKWIEDVFSEPI